MFKKLFKKKNIDSTEDKIILIAALLIHAAKIDENYSEKEKKIIVEFTTMLTNSFEESGKNIKNFSQEYILNLVKKAEEFESNSSQILEYTKEVKKMNLKTKHLVLEFLWKI